MIIELSASLHMTLYMLVPSPLPLPVPLTLNNNSYKTCNTSRLCNLLITYPLKQENKTRCCNSNTHEEVCEETGTPSSTSLLDGSFLSDVSAAKDANQVLDMIAEKSKKNSGTLSNSDCALIIAAAFRRNNADLALSVFSSMRSTFDPVGDEKDSAISRWRWSRPDVRTYTLLLQGLAASLRVSDALKIIGSSSTNEEVSFGKVIKCPSCRVAVAVAQPQHGIQVVSCYKCRFKYELFSGNICKIESEEISMDIPSWRRALSFLQIMKQNIPTAVHSIVVETPSGVARTYRFATETVDLPAQEGERVTISLAAPSNVYTEVGPLKFSPRDQNFYPGEPLHLTNHTDGQESPLLRAPSKDRQTSLLNPSILFPLLLILSTGDVASGLIDPNLPQLIPVISVSSVVVGATFMTLVLPRFNKLSARLVDLIATRQQMLSQYDILQSRIKQLKAAAENEIWMLARMYQLENKIVAVGEPSYRSRRSRLRKVREGLENSLHRRIELIESYTRISSMIEIEVQMDSDVLAAEGASDTGNIGEQIQQIMELEDLEEKWRLQAEVNDDVERLLRSEIVPAEQVER